MPETCSCCRTTAEGGELGRWIGLFQLTLFGVGSTIGAGIFIMLSEAGPAIIISFVLAGVMASPCG